jgi:hypothetical protein
MKIIHKYYFLDMSLNMADAAGCSLDKPLCCAQDNYKILFVQEHFSPPLRKQTLSQ